MKRFIRILFSGLVGMFIVASLFILMGFLIDGNKQRIFSTDLTDQKIKFEAIPPKPRAEPKSIEVQKPKKALPKQQQAPKLELTETGSMDVGNGSSGLINQIGAQFGSMAIGKNNGIDQGGGNYRHNPTMMKQYDHKFKFPKVAIKAGITNGRLDVRAVFNTKHEFLRFEILRETTEYVFREILNQLDFNHKSTKHLKYADQGYNLEHFFNDAKSEYSYTYKFLFDSNNLNEPIRFYSSKFYYTNELVH